MRCYTPLYTKRALPLGLQERRNSTSMGTYRLPLLVEFRTCHAVREGVRRMGEQ